MPAFSALSVPVDFQRSTIPSPVIVEAEPWTVSVESSLELREIFEEWIFQTIDANVFVTPPLSKTRDVDVQTVEPVALEPVLETPPREEIFETPPSSLPPFMETVFSHMNGVNQWINRFSASSEGIQNDIGTIRVCWLSLIGERIVSVR